MSKFVVRAKLTLDEIFARHTYPHNLTFFLTERCNLKCPFCFVAHDERPRRREMSAEDAGKILSSAKFQRVVFTGGEPMVYKDFDKILEFSHQLDACAVIIATNGFLYEKLVAALQNRNPRTEYTVQFSLDGPKTLHNEIRRSEKAYDDCMNAIAAVRSLKGINVGLTTTISKVNLPYLEEIIAAARELDAPLVMNFVRSSREAKSAEINDYIPVQSNDLTLDEMKAAGETYLRLTRYMDKTYRTLRRTMLNNYLTFVERGVWRYGCGAGIHDAVVYPNGDVAVCETLKPLGNLFDYDLDYQRFWQSHYSRKLRDCYCGYDCAMHYSTTKSLKGFAELGKSFISA